jgi:hypothetical protein
MSGLLIVLLVYINVRLVKSEIRQTVFSVLKILSEIMTSQIVLARMDISRFQLEFVRNVKLIVPHAQLFL